MPGDYRPGPRATPAGYEACVAGDGSSGLKRASTRPAECVVLQPRRRWKGLWGKHFELSRFCPEPATECGYGRGGIWLTFVDDLPREVGMRSVRLWSIEFEGRRTRDEGRYGHIGGSAHQMFVERIISVTPPPDDEGR